MCGMQELDKWQQDLYENEDFNQLVQAVSEKLCDILSSNLSDKNNLSEINLKNILLEDAFKSKLSYQYFVDVQEKFYSEQEANRNHLEDVS